MHLPKSKLRSLWPAVFLSFIAACSFPSKVPDSPGPGLARLTGKITFQGNRMPGARVYVYEVPELFVEKAGDEERIKELLRARENNADILPTETWDADQLPESEEEFGNDYLEFRGPADFKSAPSGKDGFYDLPVTPGRYVAVARKRRAGDVAAGPLTPDDYSSLVSRPVIVEEGEIRRLDLSLESLAGQSINFASRYAVKTRETEIRGLLLDERKGPLAGYYVTANGSHKVSDRPDFYAEASNERGEFTLYLPGAGVYYLHLRRTPLGNTVPVEIKSEYVNPADNSVEILEGELLEGITVFLRAPQAKATP